MKDKKETYCMGQHCSVKKQCMRYTCGIEKTIADGTQVKYMRKCTNQKMYIKNEERVVKGR